MQWLWKAAVLLTQNGGSMLRWILAALVFVAAPIYLAFRPEEYTPLVQVLISLIFFWLAYQIGMHKEVEAATQKANDRWLPQAESVIFRLMTLHANVKRFSHSTKSNCSTTACDLPELEQNNMRAVKVKLKTDCAASGQRLDDIAHQLEDAIEDWRRFVSANCNGDECMRILEALLRRQEKLEQELSASDEVQNLGTSDHSTAVPTVSQPLPPTEAATLDLHKPVDDTPVAARYCSPHVPSASLPTKCCKCVSQPRTPARRSSIGVFSPDFSTH